MSMAPRRKSGCLLTSITRVSKFVHPWRGQWPGLEWNASEDKTSAGCIAWQGLQSSEAVEKPMKILDFPEGTLRLLVLEWMENSK